VRQYNDQLGMVHEWASMKGRLGMVELRVNRICHRYSTGQDLSHCTHTYKGTYHTVICAVSDKTCGSA
jgi:hypothetical protein